MSEHEQNESHPLRIRKRGIVYLASGAAAAGMITLLVAYGAYSYGRGRGRKLERIRLLSREQAVQMFERPVQPPTQRPPSLPPDTKHLARPDRPAGIPTRQTVPDLKPRETWVFGPEQCVRMVWPLEIVPRLEGTREYVFRLRQGANRFARPGTGLSEFVFDLADEALVSIYIHARFSDECANTVECSIDGGARFWIIGRKIYNRWLWEQSPRSVQLSAGRHRVSIEASEDGLEYDRVVVTAIRPGRPMLKWSDLDALDITPSPVFASVPPMRSLLPRIDGMSAQAFPTGSLVVGAGHENRVGIALRLNDDRPRAGRVTVGVGRGITEIRHYTLSPDRRFVFMEMPLALRRAYVSYTPVTVEVTDADQVVHSQTIRFVNPQDWAFLGPFPDPERKGLDLKLPPDDRIRELAQLADMEGMSWRVITDGSCYDSFGLVDLNKVYGLENVHWATNARVNTEPMVAYALTYILSDSSHHRPAAVAADDCFQLWVNGTEVLRVTGSTPIETSRQILGLELQKGLPVRGRGGRAYSLVFKVPQTEYYWKILLEPDDSMPYGRPIRFCPLSRDLWPTLK